MRHFLYLMTSFFVASTAYAHVQCPTTLVVVSCKAEASGPPDQNGFIAHRWVIKDAMLVCRRNEVTLADAAEMQGAPPLAHNFSKMEQCARAAVMLASDYDRSHKGWFVLTVGCPTPIINRLADGSEEIIGYQMPPCPSWVRCELDSVI